MGALAAEVAIALVVGEDHDDVGLAGGWIGAWTGLAAGEDKDANSRCAEGHDLDT